LHQINWALFVEEGFSGDRDDYYEARNSFLNRVIDLKKGIPISLCILYSSIAERLGLHLDGLNLPAHFMLKHETPEGLHFIDAFHGDLLDRGGCERRLSSILQRRFRLSEGYLIACPARDIIVRLLKNLRAVFLRDGDYSSLILVHRRLTSLRPEDPRELRALGLLYFRLGRLNEAVAALEGYLDTIPPGVDDEVEPIRTILRDARREIALLN
jgi:regulator of sirC expression with transglutaminase-like and TPR domain